MKRYFDFFIKYKRGLIFIGILSVVNLFFTVIFPYINGRFIDNLVVSGSYSSIVFWALLIFMVGFLNACIEFNITCKTKKINEKIYYDVRKFLMDHFRKISILKFRENNASHLNRRIEMNITRIIAFFLDNYVLFFAQMFELITIFVILYFISWEILLCICAILPIYWWVYTHFKAPIFHDSLAVREKTSDLYQVMNEQLEYMEDIVIESNYKVQDTIFKNKFNKYYEAVNQYTKTIAKFKMSQGTFVVMFQVLVFLLGGYFVLNGKMTVGKLTMITTYFSLSMGVISYYVELAKNYQITKSSIYDMDGLFDIEEEREGKELITRIDEVNAKLKFSYCSNSPDVLDTEIRAAAGECIGIIGVNGSGKTTLSKLLIGSIKGEEKDHCHVLYNSKYKLSEMNSVALRSENVSYIPQKIRHVNVSIQEIFNEVHDYEDEKQVLDELNRLGILLPEETKKFLANVWKKNIEDLSGGDKQLIIILKCFLKNTSMMIFDEPSSNLDKGRIEWLKKTITQIKNSKIIFIISHDKELFDIFDKTVQLG